MDINEEKESVRNMCTREYIHYGDDEFHPEKVGKYYIDNNGFRFVNPIPGKPVAAFWASAIDANYGWKNFCSENDMEDRLEKMFVFHLADNANILHIWSPEDISHLIIHGIIHGEEDGKEYNWLDWDFDWDIIKHGHGNQPGYDGMELHYWNYEGDVRLGADTHALFNTWDCDSIAIWNPDIIIPDKLISHESNNDQDTWIYERNRIKMVKVVSTYWSQIADDEEL